MDDAAGPDKTRFARVKEIFAGAQRLGAECDAFLDRACADDPTLRAEVKEMLSAANSANDAFLARPPIVLGSILTEDEGHPIAVRSTDAALSRKRSMIPWAA